MSSGIGEMLGRVQSLIGRFQGLGTPARPAETGASQGLFRSSGFRSDRAVPMSAAIGAGAVVPGLPESGSRTDLPVQPGGAAWAGVMPAAPAFGTRAVGGQSRVAGARQQGTAGAESPERFDELIERYAEQFKVDPNLVRAVMRAESGFNPTVVSRAGAKGLMQLMDGTSRRLGVGDPFDPAENVRGGVRFLRDLLDRFGDVRLALAAYNAGPGAVERYGGIPPYPETQTYVRRVLDYHQQYQAGRQTGGMIDRKG